MNEDNVPNRTHPNYDNVGVDRYAISHLHSGSPMLNSTVAQASANNRSAGLPYWDTIPSHGKFFMLQCRLMNVKHVLEVGAFGGHAAIWCAAASPSIRVTTIEMDEGYAQVARENLQAAGVSDRVELIVGRAQDVLLKVSNEIRSGGRERFGMVIVDVNDMAQTWEIFDQSISLCVGGACILAHCVVRKSNLSVEKTEEANDSVKGSRELVERVGKDDRVDGLLLMTVGEEFYDTIMAAVRSDIEI